MTDADIKNNIDIKVRDNPLDAYKDAMIYGSGVWQSGEVDDERHPINEVPPMPEPATDPYEVDTP